MSQRSTITLVVNGARRRIVCEQGQEEHLQHAGKYLDKRLREMKSNVGNIAENELFVLTALMLIDDLSEAHTRIAELQKTLNNAASSSQARLAHDAIPVDAIPVGASPVNALPVNERRLEQTTRRIEQLAKLFEAG